MTAITLGLLALLVLVWSALRIGAEADAPYRSDELREAISRAARRRREGR